MRIIVESAKMVENFDDNQAILERVKTHMNRFSSFMLKSVEERTVDFSVMEEIYEDYLSDWKDIGQNRLDLLHVLREAQTDENR